MLQWTQTYDHNNAELLHYISILENREFHCYVSLNTFRGIKLIYYVIYYKLNLLDWYSCFRYEIKLFIQFTPKNIEFLLNEAHKNLLIELL